MPLQLKGTGVALVTPFDNDNKVDYKSLEKLVEHVVSNGVDFLVCLGTTAETPTLIADEKRKIVDKTLEVNNRRIPLLVGFGGNNTAGLESAVKTFNMDGIDGILSASPSYNKPSQNGIYEHYKRLSESTHIDIILYNVPSRTASNITAETTLKLSEIPNITGIKEASGDLEQCMEIIRNKGGDFCFLSGDDLLTLPLMAIGGDGVISVVANAFPASFSAMVNNCLDQKYTEAKNIHYRLMETIHLLFVEGNPAGVKCALELMHICKSNLRLPLVQVSKQTRDALAREIEKLKSEKSFMHHQLP